EVASLAERVGDGPAVVMISTLRRTSSAARSGSRSPFPLGRLIVNDNVFTLDITKLAQTLPECFDAIRDTSRGRRFENPNPWDFRRLLGFSDDCKSKQQHHK